VTELRARSPFDGLRMPQGDGVAIRALEELPVRLSTGASAPGPGWRQIAPREWLTFEDGAAGIDIGHALAGLAVEGPGAEALIAMGASLDLAALPDGGLTRTRLGQLAVILDRVARDRFRMVVPAPCLRHALDWLDHHVGR